MSPGSHGPSLRDFELLVTLAVLHLVQRGDGAYPLAIAREIEKRAARKASRAAVLITLERLEDKGFVTSHFGDPTAVRGGRSKRLFLPKPAAVKAVRQSLHRIDALRAGLDPVLRPR